MQISRTHVAQECAEAKNLFELHQIKAHYLGKKGIISQEIKNLRECDPEQRPQKAAQLNEMKDFILAIIQQEEERIERAKEDEALTQACPDPTLPGVLSLGKTGTYHPIMTIMRELIGLFMRRGFDWGEGPEVEDVFYNFEALNIPADHPARQMQDTLYLSDPQYVLRTHTSPVQIRYCQNRQAPLKMIAPGRVYRHDFDPTHTPMFHQIEGLCIGPEATVANLRSILLEVLSEFFEQPVELRFRPSYFPFTDPSMEVDIGCVVCQQKGCSVCKHSGWIEVLGCGIVHQFVLEKMGFDHNVDGYAFGMGVERLAMLKYRVPDLRLFFENHADFLAQFPGGRTI